MKKILFSLILALTSLYIFAQNTLMYSSSTGNLLSDPTYFCAGDSFNLNTSVQASSTGNYFVGNFNQNLTTSGNIVPFPNTNGNNHFSSALTLPFTFNFYGKTYTKIVVGSNGRLIFGNGTDLDSFANFADVVANQKIPHSAYQNIGGTNYALPQIFFGFNSKNYQPTDYGKITYTSTKIGTRDVFGVTITGVNPAGNYSRKINSSVFLVKDTNEIIIQYYETDGSGLFQAGTISQDTVLGLQDDTATKGKWPSLTSTDNDPNSPYRLGRWTNSQTAFIFTPNQNLTPTYSWKVNGVEKSTVSTFNYTPTAPQETLTLSVSFVEMPSDVRTSTVVFKTYDKPIISETPDGGCVQSSKLTVTNPVSNYTYTWFLNNVQIPQTGKEISVTQSGSYTVKVNGCDSAVSDPVAVVIPPGIAAPNFIDGYNFQFCDALGSSSKTVNLASVTGYIPAAGVSVEYQDASGAVISPDVTLNSGETKSFKLKITTGTCSQTFNFSITYNSLPIDGRIYTVDGLCSYTTGYSTAEFKNKFYPAQNYNFSFSTDGINFNQNSVNPTQNNPVWVKIELPGVGCTSIGKINFELNPAVTANTPTTQLPPQCGNPTQTFDLGSLIPEINSSPNVTVTFHETQADALTGANPVNLNYRSGLGTNTLYIRVKDNSTGCVAQNIPAISLTVYEKPKILKQNIPLTNCEGNTIFNLTQNTSNLTDAVAPVIVELHYFAGNGQEIFGSDITAYNTVTFGNNPTVQVKYNPTCSDIIPFTLNYNPKPSALTSEIKYCDENSFTWDKIKNQIIANPQNYTFYEQDGITPLRTTFNVNQSVNYLIKNIATGCLSDLQTINFVQKAPISLLKTTSDFTDCDITGDFFDGKTTFDLSLRKADFTTDASAAVKFYYDAARTQEITAPKTFINTVPFAQTIYLKIESADYCPTNAVLNLTVNTPTKSTTLLPKYHICFGETVTVDAGTGNISYKWSDGQTGQTAYFSVPETYSVTMMNAQRCSYTQQFEVSDENQPKITAINQADDKIEVIVTGGKSPYTYYFNGISNGTSNILLNPTASQYEIYAVSADGCRGPSKFLYTILVKNVITPNGDGYNDTWKIGNLDKMDNVEMLISDRFGKAVFHSTDGNQAWDGTSAGRVLPTSTYWYIVKWHDSVTNKDEARQGWILLKNRD